MITTEKTMEALRLFFEKEEDLRIFAMNGSMINDNIPNDKFKDYDVVFFTENITKYKENKHFLEKFGEPLLITEPDGAGHFYELTYPKRDGYTYLVQYKSGLRIDFQFMKLTRLEQYLSEETLTKIISDKENRTPLIFPTEQSYWLKPPTQDELSYCVKEFYWQFLNTLKARLRGEFLLAQFYLNLTRKELIRLITWSVAYKKGFERNYGKENYRIFHFLTEADIILLKKTFDASSEEKIDEALKILFRLEKTFLIQLSNDSFLDFSSFDNYTTIPNAYLISKDEEALAEYFQFSDET